ncbi:MAG: ribonucleoside-diphosphate reductase subunit alpha, partial [Treponema sp.]|nr:ribonucleoside-diphosphate reductase subunit alpha [Treponema sp.]
MTMKITKRDGSEQSYESAKIKNALEKALISAGAPYDAAELTQLVAEIEAQIGGTEGVSVETIQDHAETALMKAGQYEAAKRFILYRSERAQLREARNELLGLLPGAELERCLHDIERDFPSKPYALARLSAKFKTFSKPGMTIDESLSALTRAAVELTGKDEPQWELIAGRLLYHEFSRKLRAEEEKR